MSKKRVCEKLCQAQKSLPLGWRFRVYEDFRSRKIQQMLFDQQCQKILQKFPDKQKGEIFYETTRPVSPVRNFDGTTNIPERKARFAIGFEIIAKDAELVGMGMAIKDWQKVNPDLCQTDCSLLEQDISKNRKIFA